MIWDQGGVLKEGNIGTHCGIIPATVSARGVWELRRGGDFNFYESLLRHVRHVQYIDQVIYTVWDRDRNLFD